MSASSTVTGTVQVHLLQPSVTRVTTQSHGLLQQLSACCLDRQGVSSARRHVETCVENADSCSLIAALPVCPST